MSIRLHGSWLVLIGNVQVNFWLYLAFCVIFSYLHCISKNGILVYFIFCIVCTV